MTNLTPKTNADYKKKILHRPSVCPKLPRKNHISNFYALLAFLTIDCNETLSTIDDGKATFVIFERKFF